MTVGLTKSQVLALPAAVDVATGGRAFGFGRTKSFQLARQGQFPVPVLRRGRDYRVMRADILKALGISEAEQDWIAG